MIVIEYLGITLFLYVPLANSLVTSGHRVEVVQWIGIALVATVLPDLDIVVAAIVTAVSRVRSSTSFAEYTRRAMLGFTVGAGTVVGHLIGDVITPMGVRPFYPVDSVYTLNLVYAKDLGANLAFVVVGIMVFWMVYRRSKDPIPTDPTSTELAADLEIPSVCP